MNITDEELKTLQDIDIKELADIYDGESEDTFLTIFVDLTDKKWKKFVEDRYRKCEKALHRSRPLLENLNATYGKLMELLEDVPHVSDERGLCLIGSDKMGFYRIYQLPVPPENNFVVDSSPFVKPLALLRDQWEQFALVFIDGTGAQLYLVGARMITNEKKVETEVMGRHKKGGWSQMRFNRARKGVINKFYDAVARDLGELIEGEEHPVVSVVVTGPGKAKKEFVEHMPDQLKEMVSHVLDIDSHVGLSELVRSATEIIHQDEKETSIKGLELLRKLILTDGPATYGLSKIVKEARNGNVKKLFLLKDMAEPGWICENCQAVERGLKTKCPYCKGATSRVEVGEEIAEFVIRTGGVLEFVDESSYLEGLGGVAAILRYGVE